MPVIHACNVTALISYISDPRVKLKDRSWLTTYILSKGYKQVTIYRWCPLYNYTDLSPIYTLQLAAKFGFQPRTSKSDNFGPPTLEKVQLSTFWAVLWVNSTFDIFGSAEILYYFFEHLNVLKWKNSKLQSCRSHRGLNLHIKIIFIRHRIKGFSIFWN